MTAIFAPLALLACQIVADLDAPGDTHDAPDASAGAADQHATDDAARVACGETLPSRPEGGDGPNLPQPLYLVFRYCDPATTPKNTTEPVCATSGFSLANVEAVDVPVDDTNADGGAEVVKDHRQHCGSSAPTQGIDNYAGEHLADLVQTATGLAHSEFVRSETALETGGENVMLQIADYNGEADDPHVTVGFFSLVGIATPARPVFDAATAPDSSLDPLTWSTPWDRSAKVEWPLDDSSALQTGQPRLRVDGYVTHHVLVAHSASMPILFSSTAVTIERVTLSGYLEKVNERWRIAYGRIGGEVRLHTVAETVARLTTDARVCQLAQSIVPAACSGADRGFPGRSCDAMSLAMSFTMVEGVPGELRHVEAVPANCDVVCQ